MRGQNGSRLEEKQKPDPPADGKTDLYIRLILRTLKYIIQRSILLPLLALRKILRISFRILRLALAPTFTSLSIC